MTTDPRISAALANGRNIEMTTIGRKTSRPHRIEIWLNNISGSLYIIGSPTRKDWYANVRANPAVTIHLDDLEADIPAWARPIADLAQRRIILTAALDVMGRTDEVATWISKSPVVELVLAPPSDA